MMSTGATQRDLTRSPCLCLSQAGGGRRRAEVTRPAPDVRLPSAVSQPIGAATVAGSYALTVQVTAEDDPTNDASAVVALTVGSGRWLDMGVQPAEVEGREATFRITFVNRSHTPVPVRLAASDREDRLRF